MLPHSACAESTTMNSGYEKCFKMRSSVAWQCQERTISSGVYSFEFHSELSMNYFGGLLSYDTILCKYDMCATISVCITWEMIVQVTFPLSLLKLILKSKANYPCFLWRLELLLRLSFFYTPMHAQRNLHPLSRIHKHFETHPEQAENTF